VGKTTAISILLGLRRPDTGRVELFGREPWHPAARAAIGATPQDAAFPQTLRVGEVVDLVRAHYGRPEPRDQLLERFGLREVARRQTGGLSGGQRRRLALALAFAGRPRAVFLDEPTTGLDVEARRSVWAEIERYGEGGGTVLLTTHHLEEAERLASRIVLVAAGRVVAQGTSAELTRLAGAAALEEAFLSLVEAGA
jgi:ABC-2 type transport system ATP-binding protein